MNIFAKIIQFIFQIAIIATIVIFGGAWILKLNSNNIVFQPSNSHTSINDGPNFESINIRNSNNENFVIRKYQAKLATNDKVILYLHGNAGRLYHFMDPLSNAGTIYSPAYLGFNESEGSPTPENTHEVALKSYDYLVNTLKIDESKITILGHSLGGAVANYIASIRPKASKLVVINSFSSIKSMCERQYGIICMLTGDIFDSASYASKVTIPTVEFVYKFDKTVPYEEGIKLSKSYTNTKSFKLIEQSKNSHAFLDWELILKEI
jgi:dienelactone hydrolase